MSLVEPVELGEFVIVVVFELGWIGVSRFGVIGVS